VDVVPRTCSTIYTLNKHIREDEDGVVIGFTDNQGNPKLYSKRIKKGELDFLKE